MENDHNLDGFVLGELPDRANDRVRLRVGDRIAECRIVREHAPDGDVRFGFVLYEIVPGSYTERVIARSFAPYRLRSVAINRCIAEFVWWSQTEIGVRCGWHVVRDGLLRLFRECEEGDRSPRRRGSRRPPE